MAFRVVRRPEARYKTAKGACAPLALLHRNPCKTRARRVSVNVVIDELAVVPVPREVADQRVVALL
jgi:hypothetical protein